MNKQTLNELRSELASVRRWLDAIEARLVFAEGQEGAGQAVPDSVVPFVDEASAAGPSVSVIGEGAVSGDSASGVFESAESDSPTEAVGSTPSTTLEAMVIARERAQARAEGGAPPTDDATGLAEAVAVPREQRMPTKPHMSGGISQLEWLVGAKGIVLLGVVILMVAAGLFLKEAWSRGWIATIPDGLRCAFGGGFGAALLVLGEIVRRRINPLASSGLSAAGIAIVYGSILAAAELYGLLPAPAAFAMLVLTTLLGIGLGALSSRVMLAAFSLIGAFLVPIVLGSEEPSRVVMPAYLVALLGLGLGLTAWRGPKFAIIRRIAWWGTASLGSLWVLSIHDAAPISALVFIGAVWMMTAGELVASARFFRWIRPDHSWPDSGTHGMTRNEAEGTIEFDLAALLRPEARWLNSIFGITAWSVIAAGFVVTRWLPAFDWLVPMSLALASILLMLACSPQRPRPWVSASVPMSALASAMALNAASLIALTIATGLGGAMQVFAWCFVGLAAVFFGWRVRFLAANLLGLAFLAVGTARLVLHDLPEAAGMTGDSRADELVRILGLSVTAWTGQMVLVAVTLAAAAAMQRRRQLCRVLDVGALAGLAMCVIGPGSAIVSVGAAWCVLAVAGAWLGARIPRIGLCLGAAGLLCIGTLATGLAGLSAANTAEATHVLARLGLAWSDWSWAMVLVGACWVGAAKLLARNVEHRSIGAFVAIAALSLAIFGDETPMQTVVLAWAVLYAVITLLGLGISGWRLVELAVGFALVNGIVWAGVVWNEGWPGPEGVPILHGLFITGAIVAATLGGGAWLLARTESVPHASDFGDERIALTLAGSAGCGVMTLVVTSFEIMRITEQALPDEAAAQGAALSIWWSLFAVATIAMGIARRTSAVRWAGLILIAVAAGKVLLVDLSTLTPMWRIVGSAVVGMVLLGAGIAYAWLMRDGGRAADVNALEPEPHESHEDVARAIPGEPGS